MSILKYTPVRLIIVIVLLMCVTLTVLCFCGVFKKEQVPITSDDFNFVADDVNAAKENSKCLRKMIDAVKDNEASEIVFESGTYYFDTSDGGIICDGIKNLTFVGNDTLFVNSSYNNSVSDDYFSTCFIATSNSSNIKFKNISFDYLDYTSLNGKVVSRTNRKIIIKPDSEFFSSTMHNAITGGELVYAVSEFATDTNKYLNDYYLEKPITLKLGKDKQTVELDGFNNTVKVGSTVVLRFGLGEKIPGFIISNTKGFYMENVNVFSSPCAVVYSVAGSSDFVFDGLKVAPRDGSKMLFSANVDGVHLKNFSDSVTLKNCTFNGMGDDAFNTNSRAALVTSVDGKEISVKSGFAAEEMPENWAQKGDVLNVYNKDWELLGQITVDDYNDDKIKSAAAVDSAFIDCYLENTRYLPKVLIENTTVDLSRARGFMLRSKNITVSKCTVKNTALPAIIASPDINNWYEMSPCENVTITGCVFDNCGTADWTEGGVITFKYADDSLNTYSPKIHKNVTISNNSFTNHRIYAVYAAGVDGINVVDNTIENQTLNLMTVNCDKLDTDIQN